MDSDWDSVAAQLPSSALIPAATDAPAPAKPPAAPETPAAAKPPPPVTDVAAKAAPAATAIAVEPAAAITGLPPEVQEQLFGVLQAALGATLLPLLEKQQELEARLASLDKAAPAAPPGRAAIVAAPVASPVPVASPSVAPAPKPSLVPTSFGSVIVQDGPARRPSIEVALENLGPIDVPDFGRGRRNAGRILVGLLLAVMVAAVTATILSHT